MPHGRQADDRGRAARRQHREGLLARGLPAEGFEGVLDATARELLHLAHRIAGGRVDGVGRAERARAVELLGGDVDRDHAGGTGDHRALHDVETDAAAADDGDRRAGRNLRGVEHRAETGGDRAAHERGDVDRHLLVDLQQRLLGEEHLLGESADARELVDRHAVLGQRRTEARPCGWAGSGTCADDRWCTSGTIRTRPTCTRSLRRPDGSR